MNIVTSVELSRVISHALRHAPNEYGLTLDPEGWVSMDDLTAGIRASGHRWALITAADIENAVHSSDKDRHEVVDSRIRARYGHSVAQLLYRDTVAPPTVLFHGTSAEAYELIAIEGLLPMGRQTVHLSIDVEGAKIVGRRKVPNPVILRVLAAASAAEGARYSRGNDTTWLTDFVAPEFIFVEGSRA